MAAIRQTSFAAGELAPSLHARSDLERYGQGLRRCRNAFISRHGAAVSRPGTRYVGSTLDHGPARLLPFLHTEEQSYVLEVGDEYVRVWSSQAGAIVATLSSPWGADDLETLAWAQVGDIITICHPDHPPHEIRRISQAEWTIEEVDFGVQIYPGAEPVALNMTVDARLPTPDPPEYLGREWEVMVTAVYVHSDGSLRESAPAQVQRTISTVPYRPNGDMPRVLAIYPDRPLVIRFLGAPPSWAPRILESRIYRGRNGVWGYVGRVQGKQEHAIFIDEGDEPDYFIQPPEGRNPFRADNPQVEHFRIERPMCVTFFEGRQVFGGTRERPNRIWASATNNFLNFDRQVPARADQSVELELASQHREEIRALLGRERLLVFTSTGVWSIAGSGGAPLSAADLPEARKHLDVGAARLPPLAVDNAILFVTASGRMVHDLLYSLERRTYTGMDVSALARHLLEAGIREWAWVREPEGLVWAVRNDGALLSLTYSRDDGLVAWAQHETDGVVESICSVTAGTDTVVYLVVRRTVNGHQRRYIERLDNDRTVALDSAVMRTIVPTEEGTISITGLDHLEGKDVWALARRITSSGAEGWNVSGPHRVTGGQIEVPLRSGLHQVWVGLGFQVELELLDVGEARTRAKRVTRVTWEVNESRGFWTGASWERLVEWRQREVQDGWGPIPVASGSIEVSVTGAWDRHGRACLRQVDPLPLTVLAVTREVEFGG